MIPDRPQSRVELVDHLVQRRLHPSHGAASVFLTALARRDIARATRQAPGLTTYSPTEALLAVLAALLRHAGAGYDSIREVAERLRQEPDLAAAVHTAAHLVLVPSGGAWDLTDERVDGAAEQQGAIRVGDLLGAS